jgi:uncharacterized protein (TIGR03905 family)
MNPTANNRRFVFHTQGVCPPEIHFRIAGDTVKDIRFVGGGCPGNARLVSRLLQDRPLREIKTALEGIPCRNGTSCPDQLAIAIEAAESGRLQPAESFRILEDSENKKRIGLVGSLEGDPHVLSPLLAHVSSGKADTVYLVGNLTGYTETNAEFLKAARKISVTMLQGDRDWRYAQEAEADELPPLGQRDRDWLLQLPQVVRFNIGQRSGMAFYGEFIQQMPGFSDFEPFALEINMVCGLTRFMSDEEVFPALEAMAPQFTADLVVFGQTGRWGHWQVGGKDFVSVGAARMDGQLSWGLLEVSDDGVRLRTMRHELP